MLWFRATFPRLRFDHLVGFAWKFLVPLSLVNLLLAALVVKLTESLWGQAGLMLLANILLIAVTAFILNRAANKVKEKGLRFAVVEKSELVGGIPVDSEYIIFVIDTSGSMQNYSWPLLLQKINEVLDAYPTVKGIQVMNDMGAYLFSRFRGKWIPDTPARRRGIINALSSWQPFSNSSPVEGITAAIQTFWAPDKKISIYVFGDEFTGRSIEGVIRSVAQINQADAQGNRRVRIHGIGFPYVFTQPETMQSTGVRFATLMRALCHDNGGTFVGLNDFRR
jgi:hypothetical protein